MVSLSCWAGARCLEPEGWLHTYEIDTKHFVNPNFSAFVAKRRFIWFVVWDRTFMCSVFTVTLSYIDDQIFDCLLHQWLPCRRPCVPLSCLWVIWMAVIRSGWVQRAWIVMVVLLSVDLVTVSGWHQFVVSPTTHAWWNTWPYDGRYCWPSTGCFCCTHR